MRKSVLISALLLLILTLVCVNACTTPSEPKESTASSVAQSGTTDSSTQGGTTDSSIQGGTTDSSTQGGTTDSSTQSGTQGNACVHEWQWLDCTVPIICTKCGTMQGSALGHSYGAWQSKGDGSTHFRVCERNGEHIEIGYCSGGTATCASPAKCEICFADYGKIGDHVYEKQVAEDKYLNYYATCELPAKYYYSCECGVAGTSTFSYGKALGHDWGEYESMGGSHVRKCKNIDRNDDTVHAESSNCVGGAPTCTTPAICEACGGEHGELLNITYGPWVSNGDGTHTKTGLVRPDATVTEKCNGEASCTAKAYCTVCESEYGEVLPHTYKETIAPQFLKNDATCVDKAVYYLSCTCGKVSDSTFETGVPLGHDYSDWISQGNKTHLRICKRDSSHTETGDCGGFPATCTQNGICTACLSVYEPKLPHTFDRSVTEARYLKNAATCVDKAAYYYSCKCGEKGENTFEVGEALGHVYGAWGSNGDGTHTRVCQRDVTHREHGTCYGEGYNCVSYLVCGTCKSPYGTVTGHSFTLKNTSSTYLMVSATCTEPAQYYYSCRCGEKGYDYFAHGSALGHAYGGWVQTVDGKSHTKTCIRNNAHYETEECFGTVTNADGSVLCITCGGAIAFDFVTGNVAPVLNYLRVSNVGAQNLTIKFNATGKNLSYDIRYSTSPINEGNFASATRVTDVSVTGTGTVKTAVLDLAVGKNSKYYVAVQVTSNGVKSSVESIRAGGIDLVYIDPQKITSIYCGEVIKDLTPLIDEFELVSKGGLPSNRLSQFYYKAGDWLPGMLDPYYYTHERYGTELSPIFDLEYNYYIEYVYVFYSHETYDLEVRSSKEYASFDDSSRWDATNKGYPAAAFKPNSWNRIEIGKEVRFLQLQFLDGEAPVEIVFYGYQTSETEGDELTGEKHKLPTIGEMMGACGFVAGGGGNTTVEQLSCITVLREYHNLGWSYNWASFPMKSTTFIHTNVGNFDNQYRDYSPYNLIIPCLQWNEGSSPARTYDKQTGKLNSEIATFTEKYLPSTYVAYADAMYQYAARYGSSKMGYLYDNVRAHSDGGDKIGLNYIKWLEFGNEPNGEDQLGSTPYQLAALTSAAYDGHMRTLLDDVYNPEDFSYFLGAKNADPDIKVAMAGLAGIGDKYIASMCYWMRSSRYDKWGTWTSKNDTIAMDAFNVHTYFGKYFTLNGEGVYVGVSPEEYGLVDAMSALIEFRDKYYPDVEVWLTEFGWDTNESYETMTSSHGYGEYTSRQVQAMWLTRAYILMSASGVDKATMYMVEDATADRTAVGKYGTCGLFGSAYLNSEDATILYTATVWGTEYDCYMGDDGKYYYVSDNTQVTSYNSITEKMVAKPSFYYISTLYKTLYDFSFRRELESGNEDVWIYQYSNSDSDEAYALWCPTSNMTKVDGYKLYVGTDVNSVTLTETQVGYDAAGNAVPELSSKTGKQTTLTVDKGGYVYVNVSENPVYVVVDKK